jgi:hypothetical protein
MALPSPKSSYDDKQIGAVLVCCEKCGKRYYMTKPSVECFKCQRENARENITCSVPC